ncbi:MAG: DUF3849 domain-containing protein [Ruminococcaceae bacterium]|nr:DUF3849 domain-containing protein [Oscillospiraceae bacterium]
MATPDYPYLYRGSGGDAARLHEEELWEKSFRENVCCARAIEKEIRQRADHNDPSFLPDDYIAPVLEQYGFKRVSYVLAHTVKENDAIPALRSLVNDEAREWANRQNVIPDSDYGRYYEIDAAIVDVNRLVRQVQEAYQALGLFDREHCALGMYDENVEGKVLVLSPETLKETAWSPENQLWLATGGFGCDPKASGRAIYATCLGDGTETRWNREDFCGVLDGQYLPEWALEKLESLRAPTQSHNAVPVMGGMKMG